MLYLACEKALLFGQAKWASREPASEGLRKGELATISHKFSFLPRKPATPQNVKTVTANVSQIRKVTTACQVNLDSRGRIELFICKSLSQQHQSNVFNHWYVFFFHGDIELQRVRSNKSSLLWFSLHLLLKSCAYCSVEDYSPSQSELANSIFLYLVLLSFTPVASNSFPSLRSSYTATL